MIFSRPLINERGQDRRFFDKLERACRETGSPFSALHLFPQKLSYGLDQLLARHGYRREGDFYRVTEPNEDTVILFCHFGLECVLLARLLLKRAPKIFSYALWAVVLAMIWLFYGVDRLAAWLQIPYLLWVTFAAYLNFAIWWLNR